MHTQPKVPLIKYLLWVHVFLFGFLIPRMFQAHHSWSSREPLPLTPHEGHGRGHNAFAVAISAGIVGAGARPAALKTRKKKTRRIGIRVLSRTNMIIVASFLSSAEGARS